MLLIVLICFSGKMKILILFVGIVFGVRNQKDRLLNICLQELYLSLVKSSIHVYATYSGLVYENQE